MAGLIQKSTDNPFDIRDGRARVSLGPLSPKKYCTFSCPFCYVDAGFLPYANLTIDDTIAWLEGHRGKFDIIYVSGDTDSFAPPRMSEGIKLLERLTRFDVDLMFTTRAVFGTSYLTKIKQIRDDLGSHGRLLFGCTSIAQLHHQYLEPKPIPPPHARIAQLRSFKELGLVSVH